MGTACKEYDCMGASRFATGIGLVSSASVKGTRGSGLSASICAVPTRQQASSCCRAPLRLPNVTVGFILVTLAIMLPEA
eukprot:484416-Pelagomonas_calceolata.AAC.3